MLSLRLADIICLQVGSLQLCSRSYLTDHLLGFNLTTFLALLTGRLLQAISLKTNPP
jgi:hypothetical protein